MIASRIASHAAALSLMAGLPGSIASAQQADLPVTAVTLYRSGVGSFERSGTITGSTTVRLDASAQQIDDLLKSLVVLDLDGGRVGAVTYTADEPVTRLLEAVGVNSPEELSLNRILAGFKGAAVTLEVTGRDSVEGRILGVDKVTTRLSDGTGSTRHRVSVLTTTGIVTVHDDEIRSIAFANDELRADFEALLSALAQQRTEQSRSLEIELRGQGERRVSAIYTQEAPVWKTSYRVLIPDDNDGSLRLQGWAIIENTTDTDWQDITLSLAAGRPVGFTMPLSQPFFAPRQVLPVPVELAAAAKTFEAGRGGISGLRVAAERGRGQNAAGMLQRSTAPSAAMAEDGADRLMYERTLAYADSAEASFASAATTTQSGEVFFFRLDDPVTVGRRQSAMIPILTERVEGRRISIASPGDASRHPMRGLEMTNSSDLQLMPGPISVYDGDAFAGDAQIGYVGAGDDRMLAFGVDLDVDVDRRTQNRRERIEQITIRNGVIIKRVFNQVADTITITNNDEDRGRVVIAEIIALDGWELSSELPLYESTPTLHRFEIEVGPGQETKLETTQSRTSSTQLAITSLDLEQMIRYNRNGSVSQSVLDAFRGYAQRREAADAIQQRIAELDNETKRLSDDQERIRRLMGSVSRQDALHARYLRTLEQHEDRIEAIRSERAEASAERDRRQNELNTYLSTLNVD